MKGDSAPALTGCGYAWRTAVVAAFVLEVALSLLIFAVAVAKGEGFGGSLVAAAYWTLVAQPVLWLLVLLIAAASAYAARAPAVEDDGRGA